MTAKAGSKFQNDDLGLVTIIRNGWAETFDAAATAVSGIDSKLHDFGVARSGLPGLRRKGSHFFETTKTFCDFFTPMGDIS